MKLEKQVSKITENEVLKSLTTDHENKKLSHNISKSRIKFYSFLTKYGDNVHCLNFLLI